MGSVVGSLKHLFSTPVDSEDYYEHMNTDITGLGGKNTKKWMNVGYWKDALYYNDACAALADRLAEYADLEHGTTLLDAGCGCGEQDFYWKEQYPSLQITAMDITPLHIEIAELRSNKENAGIHFMEGNACRLPAEDSSFSRVCALDCAYHFDPREDFMKEAFRVLQPGGVYASSEMLPVEGEVFDKPKQVKGRAGLFLPDVNMYPVEEYRRKLENIGFRNVRYEAVGNYVYRGLCMYFVSRYLHPRKAIQDVRVRFNRKKWNQELYTGFFDFLYGTEQYYFIRAEKPE